MENEGRQLVYADQKEGTDSVRPGDSILSPARAGEAQIRGRRGRVRRRQAETRAGGACLPSLDPTLARPDPAVVSSARPSARSIRCSRGRIRRW